MVRVTRRPDDWMPVQLPNGKRYEVQSHVALWWKVFGERPVLVVASRRPATKLGGRPSKPPVFYTTDLSLSPAQVLSGYNDRWAIECLFHEAKERMGFEEPQCGRERAVARTTPFLVWTAAIVQYWFLSQMDPKLIGWRPRWRRNGAFLQRSTSKDDLVQNLRALIDSAAYAA